MIRTDTSPKTTTPSTELLCVEEPYNPDDWLRIPDPDPSMADAVEFYVEQGFSIIPIDADTKIPKVKWEQYQHSHPSDNDIKIWLERGYFNEGIAVVCGAISNGFCGIDIDDKELIDKHKINLDKMVEEGYWVEETERGYHIICRMTDGIPRWEASGGKEFLGEKRLCIICPSKKKKMMGVDNVTQLNDLVVDNGFYKKYTEIRDKLNGKKKHHTVRELKKGVPVGERNKSSFKIACKYRDQGITRNEAVTLLKKWNRKNKQPLPKSEIISTVKSAFNYDDKIVDEKTKLLDKYDVFTVDLKGKTTFHLTHLTDLIINEHGNFIVEKKSREIFREANGYYTSDAVESIIKGYADYYLGEISNTNKRKEVYEGIRDRMDLFITEDQLNPPLRYINLLNGIYDIDTKKLLPHDTDIGDYYFLNQIPVNYNHDIKFEGTRSEKFYDEVLYKDDVPVMQEGFGFCLYRRYFKHKSLMLFGGGRNGKGTTLRQLIAFLGKSNIVSKSLIAIAHDTWAVADLRGKLANLCGDIGSERLLKSENFKKATGEDEIDAQKKFGHPFIFTNYAKMIFAANKIPPTEDKTRAYYSRWIIVKYPHCFEGKEDENLTEKITTPDELTAVLNWALEGLHKLLKTNKFSNSVMSIDLENDYEILSNPMRAFVVEYVERDENSRIPITEFRSKFYDWCDEKKIEKISEYKIFNALSGVIHNAEKGKTLGSRDEERKHAYVNIKWKNDKE